MESKLREIVSKFKIDASIETVSPLGEGFINDTFIVKTFGDSPNYILQRKNHHIFPDVPNMMSNIVKVTEHIKGLVKDSMRETLTVVYAKDGMPYYKDETGNFWAVCVFIENTVTYQKADSPQLAFQGGVGIGRFQTLLQDFSEPLSETIKGFHNIRWRFEQWDESLKNNLSGRKDEVAQEISWIESRREEMLEFWSMVEEGIMPKRVVHNDTKISNILFDKDTLEVLCVIDLDTVMSSTSLNDFGDAIRSYTNTGGEDDKDLSKVSMDIDMFEAFAKGYLQERKGSLAESEINNLAFSARYITFEQVLRFLMDYIDGDKYYKTSYKEHNLVRTRAQYKLLQSMEEQFGKMTTIIENLAK